MTLPIYPHTKCLLVLLFPLETTLKLNYPWLEMTASVQWRDDRASLHFELLILRKTRILQMFAATCVQLLL